MTTIQVRTKFEGVHCYPDAPEEVAYLRHPHRHIFGVCVEVEVFHEDRELEFIKLKHVLDAYISTWPFTNGCYNLGTASCEAFAQCVYVHMSGTVSRANERYWKVTVDEDGENGASVEYHGVDQLSDNWPDGCLHKIDKGSQSMTLNEYQERAYQSIQGHCNRKETMMHWAIGLGEEAGEALSVMKHWYYDGYCGDGNDMIEDLVNELGDVMWYVASMCSVMGIYIEDVAKYNIAKLSDRYPDGRFDQERSNNRRELYDAWKKSTSHYDIMERIKQRKEK